MTILVVFGTFLFLVIVGFPIAVALALGTLIPLVTLTNMPLTVLVQKLFASLDSYGLMAVPFFIIAGGFLDKGGVSRRLVAFANSLVGWMPGGLAVVTFMASAFFGAISGSAVATVAAIGAIMLPAMKKEGYPLDFSLATVAIAGILGIIVPPSIPMVLYGISGGVSVGDIFLGGFIPGIMLASAMSLYAIMYGKKHFPAKRKFQLAEVGRAFVSAFWALLMPVIILGGIYGSIFTPTEAAAVSLFYALLVGIFIYRELSPKLLLEIMKDSVISSGSLLFIVATASAFGFLLTREQLPVMATNAVLSVSDTQFVFFVLICGILLIVGTFMDVAPATLLLSPILIPMLKSYGVHPVHFALVMIVTLGIGLVTPPVGLNLYAAANLEGVSFERVVNKHLFGYMFCALMVIVLLAAFPQLVMFLPNMMHAK
jgi:C4-dicarboxylate transporter DctM subunit